MQLGKIDRHKDKWIEDRDKFYRLGIDSERCEYT